MNFDEWYEQNAKYMNTTDFEAWMLEAWEAGKKAEREACAKVCEEGTALTAFQSKECYSYARNRAAAIRARGEK